MEPNGNRVSQTCEEQKSTFTWIALSPILFGAFFIILGLTQVLVGGTYSFVWDFATWASWAVLLYWLVGAFGLVIGIFILISKRKCD